MTVGLSRVIAARSRGYTGDGSGAASFRVPQVPYRPAPIERRPIVFRSAPVPGDSSAANFGRFTSARINGFTGSYLDFLQRGYVRYATAPADQPGPSTPADGDAIVSPQPPAPVRRTNVALAIAIATEIRRLNTEISALESGLNAQNLPTRLRSMAAPGRPSTSTLSSALRSTKKPKRDERFRQLPPVRPMPASGSLLDDIALRRERLAQLQAEQQTRLLPHR